MIHRLLAFGVLGVGVLFATPLSSAAITYSYDSLNRLLRTEYPDGTTIAYTYDSAGNRLSQVISNPSILLPKVGIDKSTLTFSAGAGQAAPSQVIVLTNSGGGNLQWDAVTTASWLTVTPGTGTNSGAVNVTASAAGLSAGTYNASVMILASASNTPLTIPVVFTVAAAQSNPTIMNGGIVSAAGASSAIARGSIASIYGSSLADGPAVAGTIPLPRTLGNVQVSVNGINAPLFYANSQQVNFQVPFEAPLQGQAAVVVTRDGVASLPTTVTLMPYVAAVFTYERVAGVFDPIIVHAANNQLVTPASPAVPGEFVIVYGTGIGDLTVLPTTGAPSPGNPPAKAKITPTVTIGNVNAAVTFAGLTPGAVGLAQVNVMVPQNLPSSSTLPLVIDFNGSSSQPVNLPVKSQAPNVETIVDGISARGIGVDAEGNVYYADNYTVWKVLPPSTADVVAGNGMAGFSGDGGPATSAEFNLVLGIAVDASGQLYIADYSNGRIRRVDVNGLITTFAGNGVNADSGDGGPAIKASLSEIQNVSVDAQGNVYVLEGLVVRRIDTTGTIFTVAGNPSCTGGGYRGDGGPASAACLNAPDAASSDAQSNLYIADSHNQRVRKVDHNGIITTFAGNGQSGFSGDGGPADQAAIDFVYGLVVDRSGNVIFSSCVNHRIRIISPTGTIATLAGTGVAGFSGDGGPPNAATFNCPTSLALGPDGALYVLDGDNTRIRRITYTAP
jgi:uncharacterized protein (TIGR03437 family)